VCLSDGSYKQNLRNWLSISTFWHFLLRTAFCKQLFSISFSKRSPQQTQRSLQYVGRTKRAILLQLSGTADHSFHLYYFADKSEVLLSSLFNTVYKSSMYIKAQIMDSALSRLPWWRNENRNQQLIVQHLKVPFHCV
jgi:hypothetical protein